MSSTGNSPAPVAPAAVAVTPDTVLGLTPAQIVGFVGTLAEAVVPGAAVAGMSIAVLTKLAIGVANEAPAAIAAFEEIVGLSKSGTSPTAAQWAAWDAAADSAHASLQAAAQAVLDGSGP